MAYSEDKKAETLALLAANGGKLRETAKQAGVPYPTLQKWANVEAKPEVAQKVTTKKASMADEAERVAKLLLGDMASTEKRKAAPLSSLAMAFGVTVDKMRLLRGESTATVEVRDDGTIFSLLLSGAEPTGETPPPDAPEPERAG